MSKKKSPESVVREIRRRTRKQYSSEEKIQIVLEGLEGEISIAELCRREGIHSECHYDNRGGSSSGLCGAFDDRRV